MKPFTRRGFALSMMAAGGSTLAACGNGIGSNGGAKIDARVDQTINYLYSRYPATAELAEKSHGMLVMPLVTEAGFGFGGGYGRGALRVDGVTVDYYSATKGSFGLQIGAQQYAHVLIFQTEPALADFRRAPGWVADAGAYYALPSGGMSLGADTITAQYPVVAMIFGQSGLMAGASIAGTKYNRIIPSTF